MGVSRFFEEVTKELEKICDEYVYLSTAFWCMARVASVQEGRKWIDDAATMFEKVFSSVIGSRGELEKYVCSSGFIVDCGVRMCEVPYAVVYRVLDYGDKSQVIARFVLKVYDEKRVSASAYIDYIRETPWLTEKVRL